MHKKQHYRKSSIKVEPTRNHKKHVQQKPINNIWVYGLHSVKSALFARRKIYRILINNKIKHKLDSDIDFSKLLDSHQSLIELVEYTEFSKYFSEEINHQGIAILIQTPPLLGIDDFVVDLKKQKLIGNDVRRVAILDRVTDVGNIGAIIRSAVAFGIRYIFIPEHHAFFDYGVLSKASSGMIEGVRIVQITNITNLLNCLKENGFWCIGFSLNAKQDLSNLPKSEKIAVILGNEHKGIRPLIEKNCDLLVSIAMDKQVESLNVSNTAAIVFHELFREG